VLLGRALLLRLRRELRGPLNHPLRRTATGLYGATAA
jgi:hypothetical protein